MAYAEKRGNLWRSRWAGPTGKLESTPGFKTRKAAEEYGRDQEAAIRRGQFVDPRAGQITLTEWVNLWFPSLDLELDTIENYRYRIEVLILPEFGERSLASLTTEEIATWEKNLASAHAYGHRTAMDARSTLITILNDAIPKHLSSNPAARRRGKGRKGLRRIQKAEKAKKVWATPLQAMLVAERCAILSGNDTDFVMTITAAYTGMRWSELIGLPPDCVHVDTIDIDWKLYELNGRFYRGRPKDGSIRTVDVPPFLRQLLETHLESQIIRKCTCRNTEPPWCTGDEYTFLGPERGHFRRSNYSERFFRPAADGWYPKSAGKNPKPAKPVLVDLRGPWPGKPLPAWPPAIPGEPFTPPTGRGFPRLVSGDRVGRCPRCERSMVLRIDGTVISHKTREGRCPGSGERPAEDVPYGSWLGLCHGLTPHGLRHGHQTWMDDAHVKYVLQAERMGHEVPGMRGTYGHITASMRADLVVALQDLWETSLDQRARLASGSPVAALEALLADRREGKTKIGSHVAPTIGH